MTRRRLIVTASLLVAGLLGAWAYDRHSARLAFADLSQCLLGAEGATSESFAVRYRRHQLPLSASIDPAAVGWPQRCVPHAKRVRDLTASPFWSRSHAMRAAFDAVAKTLEWRDPRQATTLVAAWAIAEQEGLTGLVSN